MRTALCLSGHMRTYEDTFENLKKNLIDPLDCDVYIHTWDLRDHSARGDWDDQDDNDFQKIVDTYNPKGFEVESQEKYIAYIDKIIEQNNLFSILNNVPNAVFSMYYKRRQVFKMIEGLDVKYDLVILTRPDILMSNSDDLHSHAPYRPENFPLKKITMAPSEMAGVAMKYNCKLHPGSGKIIGGYGVFAQFSDIFMAGSYENMQKMSMLYENIPSYLVERCPLHAEKLLIYHCMKNNFEIENLPGNFGLLREMNYENWWAERNKNENR